MGNKEIGVLLEKGARMICFCAAMRVQLDSERNSRARSESQFSKGPQVCRVTSCDKRRCRKPRPPGIFEVDWRSVSGRSRPWTHFAKRGRLSVSRVPKDPLGCASGMGSTSTHVRHEFEVVSFCAVCATKSSAPTRHAFFTAINQY